MLLNFELFEDILEPDGESLVAMNHRLDVAKLVVKDLSGLVVPKRIDTRNLNAHLTKEDIQEIVAQARTAEAELDG